MARVLEQSEEKKDYNDAVGFKDIIQFPGSLMTFNIAHGYLEALLRGFRSGFLSESDYRKLSQADDLEQFKLVFQETDFQDVLTAADIQQLTSEVIVDRVW
eukprot:CAMPEP_0114673312 /NCGR_PEP_ID=MMETSP0191-20121206/44498_1 /TAXON_ID=126664 /ORGANISM="Sorites sp." /LENGTH=100 /DNA_ID=CAMNT_0001937961 /DNA_START=1821 /DNA_END=2120 /DNA_ORIENTATION=-